MDVTAAYPYLKAAHVASLIAWIGGQLAVAALLLVAARGERERLPHAGELARALARRLLNPALGLTLVTGVMLVVRLGMPFLKASHWLHAKLPLVLVLAGLHGALLGAARRVAASEPSGVPRARVVAWATALVALVVVVLAVAKPF